MYGRRPDELCLTCTDEDGNEYACGNTAVLSIYKAEPFNPNFVAGANPEMGHDSDFVQGRCFVDQYNDPDLPVHAPKRQAKDLVNFDTPDPIYWCRNYCGSKGYQYAGVQWSYGCLCGNEYGKHGEAAQSECNYPCYDKAGQMCGEIGRAHV